MDAPVGISRFDSATGPRVRLPMAENQAADGAVDNEYSDGERPYEQQVDDALADVQTEPMAGGVAIDIDGKPWQDERVLRLLYHDKRMAVKEVANTLDCSVSTVHKWMRRNNVKRRDRIEESIRSNRLNPAMLETDDEGYEQWRGESCGETYRVRIHRLLAVAEKGLDPIRGKLVHHKNGIPWDNRPSNIELLSRSEHMKLHHEKGDYDDAVKNLTPGNPEVM